MILADKITELRKKNGWSQEDLAGQLNVSRQSISKWESAQSMPDMNRILKLSEVFGVSTDYLLKDEIESPVPQNDDVVLREEPYESAKSVSMEEAASFLSFREMLSGRTAVGVMLCILSPVLLVALSGVAEGGLLKISETAAMAIGLIMLLVLVGIAVALFVTDDMRGKRYEYLEKEPIDTVYGVDGMVRERKEKYRHVYSVQMVTGIVLCVLSAIPIFLSLLVFGENDAASAISVAVLLILVAAGVLLIVRSSVMWDGFQILLQEGEFTPERKEINRRNEHIGAIYWGLATAIFLAVSFLTGAWDKTWIVWPVAGVTYGVVIAIANALRRNG